MQAADPESANYPLHLNGLSGALTTRYAATKQLADLQEALEVSRRGMAAGSPGADVDAFGILNDVLDDYRSFVQGFLNIRDPEILQKVWHEVENGLLWPEPWLALNPAFQSGGSVGELVDRGLLHPGTRDIVRYRTSDDLDGREIAFHRHQTDAIEIAARRESYVLTTGTGSGKSRC